LYRQPHRQRVHLVRPVLLRVFTGSDGVLARHHALPPKVRQRPVHQRPIRRVVMSLPGGVTRLVPWIILPVIKYRLSLDWFTLAVMKYRLS
jgi:hypothetical protein